MVFSYNLTLSKVPNKSAGFTSSPAVPHRVSEPIRTPEQRHETEANVQGVLGETKTATAPISSFVTFVYLYTEAVGEL